MALLSGSIKAFKKTSKIVFVLFPVRGRRVELFCGLAILSMFIRFHLHNNYDVFYVAEEEYHFVDLDSKLQKLMPAEWKATRRVTVS